MTTRRERQAERRQRATLVAYIATGSIKAAAHQMGIAETTARQRLSAYYRRHNVSNAVQAAFELGRAARK